MKQSKIQTFLCELAADFRWSQLFAIVCLMILSTLFIYSATSWGGGGIPERVRSQTLWFAIGIGCYFLVALMDYHWLCRQSWVFYLGVLALLIWVINFERKIFGAQRWINFSGFKIQPSEFSKLSVLMVLCYYLSRYAGRLSDWKRLGFAAILAALPGYLINKQPDYGTALVIIALFLILIFLAGAPLRFFGWLGMVAILYLGAVGYDAYRYIRFHDQVVAGDISPKTPFKSYLHWDLYKFDRILVWIAPEKVNKLGRGWNREQSLIAIGNGGWNGKGWTKGDVTRGGYLPRSVSLNDFIFAVFAEETGFVGGAVLLTLYATLLIGGVRIAINAKDDLGMLLASGVTFLLFFHVFVNIGMALGILPIVGVPLPLMSYGGSFVLVSMTALGLLQSIWLHRKSY